MDCFNRFSESDHHISRLRFPDLSIRELPSTKKVNWGSVTGWSRRPDWGEHKASTASRQEWEGVSEEEEIGRRGAEFRAGLGPR